MWVQVLLGVLKGATLNTIRTIESKKVRIIRNMCRCAVCGDVIESKGVHDFVSCSCGHIFTDGGLEYLHRGFINPTDLGDLTEYEDLTLDKDKV